MPPKIRQLKAASSQAGFIKRPAKGSHTVWFHPAFPAEKVTLSGKDGDDADTYQMQLVRRVLDKLGETQ